MTVRTDTWHYKVWAWSHLEKADSQSLKNKQTSLCPYFWRVMLAFVWLPLTAIFLMTGKICGVPVICFFNRRGIKKEMFYPFCSINGDPSIGEATLGNLFLFILSILIFKMSVLAQEMGLFGLLKAFLGLVVVIVAIPALSGFLVGLFFIYDKFREWKKAPQENRSLLISYLSAVKQKVCPTINFVEKK